MHKILIVDDEKCVLESVYRTLKKEPCKLILAESAAEALDILAEEQVALIISDVKMPGMNGIELLMKAAELSPASVKMLLSGYSEVDLIVEAINKANVWRYIPKPWNNEDLVIAIRNGIEYYELQQERKELLETLAGKNAELAELNNSLEEKVRMRTDQINCHMNLLMQLLNGVDFSTFVNIVTPEIEDIFQAKKVSICLCRDGQLDSQCQSDVCKYNIDSNSLIQAAISSCETVCNDSVCVVPVVNNEEVFAVVVINDCGVEYSTHREELESLLVILKIAIQREVMKTRASSMIGDIEKLLEGC